MTNKLWFQTGIAILLALLITMVFREVRDIFNPLVIVAKTVFLPLLLAGVLFYLTRPLVNWLDRKKMPRWGGILLVFIILILAFWVLYTIIGPIVNKQAQNLAKNAPEMYEAVDNSIRYLIEQRDRLPGFAIESLEDASGKIEKWAMSFGTWFITFIQGFVQVIFLLFLIPFFLFYMLKDGEKFSPFISGFFSGERRAWVKKTLRDVDETLLSYVQGQLLVSFIVGVLLLIGYLIIGLDYSLILALFGMVTNVIPFLGPYLAVIPAIFVAWVQEPQLVIYVCIIMLVAQQIESNFISPNVMGKALDIHPLTVITLILAAGNIAGLLGVILAIPAYAVVKTISKNLYEKRKDIKKTASKEV